ncbi:MAG: ABC transporter ATP-binding protein [Chloroflexota bacterium]
MQPDNTTTDTTTQPQQTALQRWLRLISFMKPYRLWAGLALLGAITGNFLAVLIPIVIGRVIDTGVQNNDAQFMLLAGLGMVVLGLLRGVAGFLSRYFGEKLSHYIAFDIRNTVYEKVQNLSFTYHDNANIGTIVTRSISDVNELQRYYAFGLLDSLNIGLLLIGTTIVMISTSPLLAIVALSPLIPLAFASTRFATFVDPQWKRIMERTQALSNQLQENAVGAQVVRVFARENYEVDRWNEKNARLFDDYMALIGRWATYLPISAFMAALSTALVLIAGGWMESRGMAGVTVGLVVSFNAYVLQLAPPLRFSGFAILLTTQALGSSERVFEILDEEFEIKNGDAPIIPKEVRGEVVFDDVTFHYTGEKEPALKHINLHAEPGQVIGIVGATGSGKTSLVNLIGRFYDVREGRVLIDGVDVRDVDVNGLRANIGYVMQTSLLFTATIEENIAYGRTDATHEQVVAAAKAANAHGFIEEFEQGYETLVGERGVTLSGGQRQRIAIARALLVNPRILVLDDSTSSVDTQTERIIQKALETLMDGRTTFIIAQRLTSVLNADQILVLDNGEITERGTHEDLIAKGGIYAGIYAMQMEDQDRVRAEESFEGVLRLSKDEERRSTQEFKRLADMIGGD